MANQRVILNTPIGKVELCLSESALTGVSFVSSCQVSEPKTSLAKQASAELLQYFQDPAFQFGISVEYTGTDFQHKVWEALRQIPVNTTLTYGELADKLDTSARAIGNACRDNPIPVIIPCHRVVGKNGLGGYCGKVDGSILSIKEKLLNHEKNVRKHTHRSL